jgi:hypothetical protein
MPQVWGVMSSLLATQTRLLIDNFNPSPLQDNFAQNEEFFVRGLVHGSPLNLFS